MPKPPNEYRNAFEGVDVTTEVAKLLEELGWTAADLRTDHRVDDAEVVERAASCIESLMRGEFICSKCGIRKDAESSPADF